jgi:formylglycine-generating enzyme required for sulfatase activity
LARSTLLLIAGAWLLVPMLPLLGGDREKASQGPLVAAMKFVKVPKGTFWMGWDSHDRQCKQVQIKQDFELAAYAVTQGQWEVVMGNNPSHFSRKGKGSAEVKGIPDADLKRFPVDTVSWDDAQNFLKKLNAREKGKGWLYRLPTEAEWEYACRGGATSKEDCSFDFYLARPTTDLSSKQANFDGEYPAGDAERGPNLLRTTKVGSYPPNRLGLYDMHGNVLQWCGDVGNGRRRVFRGGCWFSIGWECRAAYRGRYDQAHANSYLGLRLARVRSAPR